MLSEYNESNGENAHDEQDEDDDDLKRLTRAWLNEKAAPEILGFERGSVARLLELVRAQEENIRGFDAENAGANADFIRSVFILEVDRVKFVLQSYFRTRLFKVGDLAFKRATEPLAQIEQKTSLILSKQLYRDCLSEAELEYAERFNELVTTNYQKSFMLDALPQSLQTLNDDTIVGAPELNQAVICRVRRDLGEHMLANGETIDISKNKMYILRYNTVRALLQRDIVELL